MTVLDAGVLLAIIYDEPGSNAARKELSSGVMSAVNRAEVISKLVQDGMELEEAEWHARNLIHHVVPFDEEHSTLVGSLWPKTAKYGLSLGDRACLALALQRQEPALTTDSDWKQLDIGVKIRLLRERTST